MLIKSYNAIWRHWAVNFNHKRTWKMYLYYDNRFSQWVSPERSVLLLKVFRREGRDSGPFLLTWINLNPRVDK